MKKITLIAAIMLVRFFGANATINANFTSLTFNLVGSNGNFSGINLVPDTMDYYYRVCMNPSMTGPTLFDSYTSPVLIFSGTGYMPISGSIPLSGSYLTGCWFQIISTKPNLTHTLQISDTTTPIYLSGCSGPLTVTGAVTKTNMEKIYFTVTGNAGGGINVPMTVTCFTDPGYIYSFAPQTFLISGSTDVTVSGIVSGHVDPCLNYYMDYSIYNPANGMAADYKKPTATTCSELESVSASVSGKHIEYYYKIGSMPGNWITYTISFLHFGVVEKTVTHSHVYGDGSVINTSDGVDGCLPGVYTIVTAGFDGRHVQLFPDTLYATVAGYTGIDEIVAQQNVSGKISLFSIVGKLVEEKEAILNNDEMTRISSRKDIAPGMYILKFSTSEGIFSKQIVVH